MSKVTIETASALADGKYWFRWSFDHAPDMNPGWKIVELTTTPDGRRMIDGDSIERQLNPVAQFEGHEGVTLTHEMVAVGGPLDLEIAKAAALRGGHTL